MLLSVRFVVLRQFCIFCGVCLRVCGVCVHSQVRESELHPAIRQHVAAPLRDALRRAHPRLLLVHDRYPPPPFPAMLLRESTGTVFLLQETKLFENTNKLELFSDS